MTSAAIPCPLQRRDVRREHVARAADAGRVEHGGERAGAGRHGERAGDDGALAAVRQVPDRDAVPARRAGEAQAERAGRGGELAGELGGGDRLAGRRCRRRRGRRRDGRPAADGASSGRRGGEAGGVATDEPPAPQAGSARPARASATSATSARARSAARRAASTGLRPPAGRRRRRPRRAGGAALARAGGCRRRRRRRLAGRVGRQVQALEQQGVHRHKDTRARHRDGGDLRPQREAEGREHAGGDRQGDGVVADRPAQVLAHLAHRAAADGDGAPDVGRVGAHQHDVGRLHRDVGARRRWRCRRRRARAPGRR